MQNKSLNLLSIALKTRDLYLSHVHWSPLKNSLGKTRNAFKIYDLNPYQNKKIQHLFWRTIWLALQLQYFLHYSKLEPCLKVGSSFICFIFLYSFLPLLLHLVWQPPFVDYMFSLVHLQSSYSPPWVPSHMCSYDVFISITLKWDFSCNKQPYAYFLIVNLLKFSHHQMSSQCLKTSSKIMKFFLFDGVVYNFNPFHCVIFTCGVTIKSQLKLKRKFYETINFEDNWFPLRWWQFFAQPNQ
jgi:hypothetical protein